MAANSSGAGKTVTTAALIAALRSLGQDVYAAKAGPDFIDAGWLAAASGHPAPSLDLWMGGKKGVRRILKRLMPDNDAILAVEGAMGLFDGDFRGHNSCAELAKSLDLPVLLLLDARGLGHSVAALAAGYLDHDPDLKFLGVVCSRVGSPKHEAILKSALRPILKKRGVPFLGFLPRAGAPQIPSRHLGLAQAPELADEFDFPGAAAWFLKNVKLPAFGPPSAPKKPDDFSPPKTAKKTDVTVAIARDEAFAFCYPDLPDVLGELGARVRFFSPLRDEAQPLCDLVYIPGGYPELYAEKLAANKNVAAALRAFAASGKPLYGECGGYVYLMESLTDAAGVTRPMLGLLPGRCAIGSKPAALGYRKVKLAASDLTGPIGARGHEFHYGRAENEGRSPLWLTESGGGKTGVDGHRNGNVMGGWTHLYPESGRGFWRYLLSLARGRTTSLKKGHNLLAGG